MLENVTVTEFIAVVILLGTFFGVIGKYLSPIFTFKKTLETLTRVVAEQTEEIKKLQEELERRQQEVEILESRIATLEITDKQHIERFEKNMLQNKMTLRSLSAIMTSLAKTDTSILESKRELEEFLIEK